VHKTNAKLPNSAPVIFSTESVWNIKAGVESKISIQVYDKQEDVITLDGILPIGATLSDIYTSEHTGIPTIDIIWTPTVEQANLWHTVTLKAKEPDTSKKLVSKKPIVLNIYVYDTTDPINKVVFNPAIVKNNMVIIGGKLVLDESTDETYFINNYNVASVWDDSHDLVIDTDMNWKMAPFMFDPYQSCLAKVQIGATIVYHQLLNCK